jgi:hypothetical protein
LPWPRRQGRSRVQRRATQRMPKAPCPHHRHSIPGSIPNLGGSPPASVRSSGGYAAVSAPRLVENPHAHAYPTAGCASCGAGPRPQGPSALAGAGAD